MTERPNPARGDEMTDENIRTESFYVDDPTHLQAELVALQNQYPGWTGSVQQQLDEPDLTWTSWGDLGGFAR